MTNTLLFSIINFLCFILLLGMQVFFMFFAILCGGIYFSEFNTFSVKEAAGFCVGIVVVFAGVYGLAPTNATVVNNAEPLDRAGGAGAAPLRPTSIAPAPEEKPAA